MSYLRTQLHRVGLGLLLLGNAIAFAGVDPPTRLATALLVLLLVIDLPAVPPTPRLHRWAGLLLAALVVAQLLPLPLVLRRVLEPGLASFVADGWAPLSVAPWATVQSATAAIVALGIALTAARIAATRSGLPLLVGLLAAVAATLALTGIASEGANPERVLLVRANTGGGNPYGPFVNSNHFAQGIELSLPAAVVLLAAAGRNLARSGQARRQAAVIALAAAATLAIGSAAIVRSGSRGGMLFLIAAAALTVQLWLRFRPGRRWPWGLVALVLGVAIVALAWTRLPAVRERFSQMLVIEGVEGNSRWDLWAGTVRLSHRAPLLGVGLGSYGHVIGLDKPPTAEQVLGDAHNDWLEWGATGGLVGALVLALALTGLARALRPSRVRRLRFEHRYPTAGAALALAATALHELVGFGLKTPLNLYLLAVWVGLLWGIAATTSRRETTAE